MEVQNRDVLDFTNAVFRRMYGNAYLDLVNNFPHFVGYFYDWLEGDGEVAAADARSVAAGRAKARPVRLRAILAPTSNGTW